MRPLADHLERAENVPTGRAEVTIDLLSEDGRVAFGSSRLWLDPIYGVENTSVFYWTEGSGTKPLDTLPGAAPTPSTYLGAITPDGSVLVGAADAADGRRKAFRRTEADGMVDISPEGAYGAWARAVSDDGNVVVGSYTTTEDGIGQAFRWTAASGAVPLGTIPDHLGSNPFFLSGDGNVVAGLSTYGTGVENVPFRWTEATGMVQTETVQGCLFYTVSVPTQTTYGPVMAGYCTEANSGIPRKPFVWLDGSGLVGVPPVPDQRDAQPYAVSRDGSVVVGRAESRLEPVAFRWADGAQASEILPPPNSAPLELLPWRWTMTADGSVIVGNSGGRGVRSAGQAGYSILEPLPGDVESMVSGISADGALVTGGSFGSVRTNVVWLRNGMVVPFVTLLAAHGVEPPPTSTFTGMLPGPRPNILHGLATSGTHETDGWILRLPE